MIPKTQSTIELHSVTSSPELEKVPSTIFLTAGLLTDLGKVNGPNVPLHEKTLEGVNAQQSELKNMGVPGDIASIIAGFAPRYSAVGNRAIFESQYKAYVDLTAAVKGLDGFELGLAVAASTYIQGAEIVYSNNLEILKDEVINLRQKLSTPDLYLIASLLPMKIKKGKLDDLLKFRNEIRGVLPDDQCKELCATILAARHFCTYIDLPVKRGVAEVFVSYTEEVSKSTGLGLLESTILSVAPLGVHSFPNITALSGSSRPHIVEYIKKAYSFVKSKMPA